VRSLEPLELSTVSPNSALTGAVSLERFKIVRGFFSFSQWIGKYDSLVQPYRTATCGRVRILLGQGSDAN
jgi:hypothetical protein